MNTIITFLNSQFISSMIGALLGAGVAVYVAKMNISYNENFLKDKKRTKENVFSYSIQLRGRRGPIKY